MSGLAEIATPVTADADGGLTRPARLTAELRRLGVIEPEAPLVRQTVRRWTPGLAVRTGRDAGILAPTFVLPGRPEPRWVDCYDDWSLAPDVHPYYRALSAGAYRLIASRRVRPRVLTVNSVYMAEKLAAGRPHLVPNGVDASLAVLDRAGDDRPRLVVLGHLFRGRTDRALLTALVSSEAFGEVVIGGVEPTADVLRPIEPFMRSGKVKTPGWMSHTDLAAIAGPNTVAAIPHVVSDYTLSQDLMKAYQFLALGLPVICPRLLWPEHLDDEFAFLVDWGADLGRALEQWVRREGPSNEWRSAFAAQHNWTARARVIGELLA